MGTKIEEIRFGILTVSDGCAQGTSQDTSGPNLKNLVEDRNGPFGSVEVMKIVPDEKLDIQNVLIAWSDELKLDIILTTGGTGFAERDVTPEATRAVIEKDAIGLSVAMLTESLKITPLAMLGRPVCGIRKRSLIINLPGSKKGAQENFLVIKPWLNHAVNHLRENRAAVNATHDKMQTQGACHHSSDHVTSSEQQSSDLADVKKVARRPRKSPFPMLGFDEACKIVMEHAKCLPKETVSIGESLRRILAEDVVAKVSVPPFRASIKDGYAVISSDGPGERQVVGSSITGGYPPIDIKPGCVVRLTTGAMVPDGADAVVQVEDTEIVVEADEGKEELTVKIIPAAKPGQDIRAVGSDIAAGDVILKEGMKLGPSEIGLLASVGINQVQVYKVPVVAIMSTGNELCEPYEVPPQGHIFDSNRTTLKMALKERDIPCLDMGIAKDSVEDLYSRLNEAISKADVIITTGGVSMGETDLLKHCLTFQLKGHIHFGRVLLKPGKPTTFATVFSGASKKLVFSLPGNPVSSIVCFNLFVLPAIRKMMGYPQPELTKIKAKLTSDVSLDQRPEFQRAQLVWSEDGIPAAHTTGNQISCRLLSMCQANALLQLPPKSDDITKLHANDVVDAFIIGEL